jgi:hypothetical protein
MEEKHDPIANFKIGSYIDAKDSVNNWCVGVVTDIDSTKVSVRFDGWSTKWNDTHLIQGPKVAPFRRFSRGYTGQ